MVFKVITFITIYAVHSRMLLSVLGSEQKLYNEQLTFPLVYKLVKLHHRFSNENSFTSLLRSVRSAHPDLFQELQYAPLYEDFSQNKKEKPVKVHKSIKNTPKPTVTPSALTETTKIFREAKTEQLYGKSHLEPRRDATCVNCYDQEHKVETTTPVNRSPGHNAVYKLIFPEALPTHEERKSKQPTHCRPNTANAQGNVRTPLRQTSRQGAAYAPARYFTPPSPPAGHRAPPPAASGTSRTSAAEPRAGPSRQSLENVDYVKPIGINLNLESLTTTTTVAPPVSMVEIASVEEEEKRPVKVKDPYILNPIDHFVINSKSIINKRYLPYAKFHRLHLNIARVYSPGQLPPKRPHLPVSNFGRRNKYGQVYAPQAYKFKSQSQDTRIYPVRHHRKEYRLHSSNLKIRNAKYS